jgi:hypothetical protein
MKPVVYHRLAGSELIKSAKYYARRNPTLGEAFLTGVEATLPKIQVNPDLGKRGRLGTRSWKTRRFPFRIVYRRDISTTKSVLRQVRLQRRAGKQIEFHTLSGNNVTNFVWFAACSIIQMVTTRSERPFGPVSLGSGLARRASLG